MCISFGDHKIKYSQYFSKWRKNHNVILEVGDRGGNRVWGFGELVKLVVQHFLGDILGISAFQFGRNYENGLLFTLIGF